MKILISRIAGGLLLAGCLAGLACSKPEPFRATTTTESGVLIVKNPAHPLYGKASLTMTEELTLSGREGDEDAFSTLDSFAVGRDGNIFVCSERAAMVKTYSRQGALLGSFRTNTPEAGGLEHPNLAGITAAGEIAIESGGHLALGFFAPDGRLLRKISLAGFNIFRLAVDSRGRILMHSFRMIHPNTLYFFRQYDAGLKELHKYGQSWEPQSAGNNYYPYLPIMWWALDAQDGVVYGYPDRYEIKSYDAGGSLSRVIRREARPVALTEAEKEAYRREYAKAPYVRLHFPEAHSAFQKFTIDEKGWIYVMTWEPAPEGAGAWYDVFDDKGIYTARVALNRMPQVWTGDRVYTLDRRASGEIVLTRNEFALDLR
ncbi:MAG: hypothetical protein PHI34_07010 [Acidobacteriota bacterium]|nr:hypothetical protein [Acidobacteriota bacterium]